MCSQSLSNSAQEPLYTILTVNYNTSSFIEVMLQSFQKLSVYRYNIIICDNGSKKKDLLNLIKVCKLHQNIKIMFRQQSSAGSIGHGEAMDMLVKNVRTPYFLTMDSDATFLIKGWDKHLLEKLKGDVKAIGTQASGNKPSDFPLMYAVMYETKAFMQSKAKFLPDKGSNIDTGMMVKEKFYNNGYKGLTLEFKNTRVWKKGAYKDLLVAEYYMENVADIFLSHFGRGATSGLHKYKSKYKLVNAIKFILIKRKAVKEKKIWLKRSMEIINSR